MSTPKDETPAPGRKSSKPRYARGDITALSERVRSPSAKRRRAAEKAKRIDLEDKVWQLYIEGNGALSFAEIARRVGCSRVTAWRYAIAAANERHRRTQGNVRLWRTVQFARLQELIQAHWKKRGHKVHADVILRAMEREAKLLGLDKPTDTGLYTHAQVQAMLEGMVTLFLQIEDDVEKRRLFEEGAHRHLPAAVDSAAMEGEIVSPDLAEGP